VFFAKDAAPCRQRKTMGCREGVQSARAAVALIGSAIAAFAALPLVAAPADTPNPDRLRGELFISGATLIDPPPEEPRDTHAYVTIEGSAARRIYGALKVADVPDLCVPGRRLKRAGHVTCSVGAKPADARCDFGLDLRQGSIAPGLVC
jgi:hypothetical protein